MCVCIYACVYAPYNQINALLLCVIINIMVNSKISQNAHQNVCLPKTQYLMVGASNFAKLLPSKNVSHSSVKVEIIYNEVL